MATQGLTLTGQQVERLRGLVYQLREFFQEGSAIWPGALTQDGDDEDETVAARAEEFFKLLAAAEVGSELPPRVGQVLRNGATVVARKEVRGGYVVLAVMDRSHHTWATWIMDREGNTFHGEYLDHFGEAVESFQKRSQ